MLRICFLYRNLCVSQLFDAEEQEGDPRVAGWWIKEAGISRV